MRSGSKSHTLIFFVVPTPRTKPTQLSHGDLVGQTVYMTRGNQRDIDRARAAARAKAHAGGSSTLKDAEDHANKLRAKQAAAEERREAERAMTTRAAALLTRSRC